MTDTTDLRDLLAKVEAGWPTHIDEPYMPPIWAVFGENWKAFEVWKANNGNTDAAIALCTSVTPGWDWAMWSFGASLYNPRVEGDVVAFDHDGEPARALLMCVIEAMIWEAEQ